jgi:hypothetical protein
LTVAVGTPKKGTKIDSFGPRPMSGESWNKRPPVIALRTRRVPDWREARSQLPKRRRPEFIAAANTRFLWRVQIPTRPCSSARCLHPASMPTKWGTSRITGLFLKAANFSAPSSCPRRRMRSGIAHHQMASNRMLQPEAAKWRRATADFRAGAICATHSSGLISGTWRRSGSRT